MLPSNLSAKPLPPLKLELAHAISYVLEALEIKDTVFFFTHTLRWKHTIIFSFYLSILVIIDDVVSS